MSEARQTTIFARASGAGRAGVGVFRVSGPRARFALETIAGAAPPPRVARLARLRDGEGAPLDDALVLWFPAPASFTGEDVAEFHIHGGRAVAAGLTEALASLEGLRPAEAGEFARRAFRNRKMDLAAAEGLADLIDSETKQQRLMALRQMSGALNAQAERWRAQLVDLQALVEAALDFSDEGDVADAVAGEIGGRAVGLRAELLRAAEASRGAERLREGFVVALVGPPNAGKSTLLNALARRDAAIVSDIPGTTRDPIEAHLDLGGHAVTLVDTAGLRETADTIERQGVRRTRERAASADLTLWLDDGMGEAPRSGLLPGGAIERLRTKIDAVAARDGERGVSALTGEGVAALEAWLAEQAAAAAGAVDAVAVRARHREALLDAAGALNRVSACEAGDGLECTAEDLRLAARAIGRLTGAVDVEDVLDRVFARFCIGK